MVIQGLDCLNIHSHNTIDDKDVKREAMDKSNERERQRNESRERRQKEARTYVIYRREKEKRRQ